MTQTTPPPRVESVACTDALPIAPAVVAGLIAQLLTGLIDLVTNFAFTAAGRPRFPRRPIPI